ncbi:MAG: HEAT repeat domain-containing protein, partial [Pirellulales bacterium]
CLGRSNREVRVAAALTLATCGTRDSVPPLLKRLTDRKPLVSQAAAIALENLTGHSEPFNPFSERGERNDQAQAWRQWFANTNWEQIEQELVRRLQSSERDVVRRAAVALGHTGGAAARMALRRYVTRERDNNPFPEWLKDHQGDNARFNSLADVNPRTLQAATRSLGYLKDAESVSMLAETVHRNRDPETANLFLAEAAVEALGRIGTPAAEAALIRAFAELREYPEYTRWYGDHDALMACHTSPVHYFITEALDTAGSKQARNILPHLIRSLPIDPDRALFLGNDDYETLVGRVIRRNGAEAEVVETCLAILGDSQAKRIEEIEVAISTVHRCWAGDPTPENRAAQIVSLVCRDANY